MTIAHTGLVMSNVWIGSFYTISASKYYGWIHRQTLKANGGRNPRTLLRKRFHLADIGSLTDPKFWVPQEFLYHG